MIPDPPGKPFAPLPPAYQIPFLHSFVEVKSFAAAAKLAPKTVPSALTKEQQQQQQPPAAANQDMIPPRGAKVEEDFPPLPSTGPLSAPIFVSVGASSLKEPPGHALPQAPPIIHAPPINHIQASVSSLSGLGQHHPIRPSEEEDDYGLRGLLFNIRRQPAEQNVAAIGLQVETLGLALDSTTPLLERARNDWECSPFDPVVAWREHSLDAIITPTSEDQIPRQLIPAEYGAVKIPPWSLDRAALLSDQTLFWIVSPYGELSRPAKDLPIEVACRALYARGWRFYTGPARCKHVKYEAFEEESLGDIVITAGFAYTGQWIQQDADQKDSQTAFICWDHASWFKWRLEIEDLTMEQINRLPFKGEGSTVDGDGMGCINCYPPEWDQIAYHGVPDDDTLEKFKKFSAQSEQLQAETFSN